MYFGGTYGKQNRAQHDVQKLHNPNNSLKTDKNRANALFNQCQQGSCFLEPPLFKATPTNFQ